MGESAFKFIKVDRFLDDINRSGCFDTEDMDGVTPNFHMVLASDCPLDIEDCLDGDGTLIDDNITFVTGNENTDGQCSLLWSKGVNGERTMSIGEAQISFNLDSDKHEIQAIFLVSGGLTFETEGSGYVIAYAINNRKVRVPSNLILPVDGMVATIRYGG